VSNDPQEVVELDSSERSGPVRRSGFSAPPTSVSSYFAERLQAIKSGELGSMPIAVGLIAIVVIFGLLEEQFLTARNFTNVLLQMSPIAFLAVGVIFVLLIADGEVISIDLSVAFVAATGGAILVLLQRPDDPGWPWWAAVLAALLFTTLVGFVHALIITKLGVPSFVMTLAAFLFWSGAVLWLTTGFSSAGTIRIEDPTLVDIANKFFDNPLVGWCLAVLVIVGYTATQLSTLRSRRSRGLGTKPSAVVALQIAAVSVAVIAAVVVANRDRGVPLITIILAFTLLVWTFVANRTRFGREVIAAAVIGGTSLFGGQGRIVSAFYGALVITAIKNGMDLMGFSSGFKFMVTGIVLLVAVLVDSVSKRRRAVRGLA